MDTDLTLAEVKRMKRAELLDLITENKLGIDPEGMKVDEVRAAIIAISDFGKDESPSEESVSSESKPDKVWLNPSAPVFVSRGKILHPAVKINGAMSVFFLVRRDECSQGYTPPNEELRKWLLGQKTPHGVPYFVEGKPEGEKAVPPPPMAG